MSRPTVLFVCVHNAGRSQMAAGYLQHLAGDRIQVLSAGSEPADQVNPIAVAAMREEGIDVSSERPQVLTTDAVRGLDAGRPRRSADRGRPSDPRRDQAPRGGSHRGPRADHLSGFARPRRRGGGGRSS